MSKNIVYNGYNKSFSVPKKRIKKGIKIIVSAFLAAIMFALCGMLINSSVNFGQSLHLVNYDEIGSIDYKVYLKENTYYEDEYLNPGLEYVASLVESINIDFDYTILANETLNYEYKYRVLADLTITKNNEPDSLLKHEQTIILEEKVATSHSSVINIEEEVIINYDSYNKIVNDYKKGNGILVDSNLVITFEVYDVVGISESIDNQLKNANNLSLTIPLSEQIIDITTEKGKINNSAYLSDIVSTSITNMPLFIVAVLVSIMGLFFVSKLISILIKIHKSKDIYAATIKKYLREYDRMIVKTHQPSINEQNFENKIRVMSIEELIDAHDSTGQPIIYYEVIPEQKSYFIIVAGNTLYKLTISRVYLESQR